MREQLAQPRAAAAAPPEVALVHRELEEAARADRPPARQPPARMTAPLPIEQIITDSLDRHAQRLQKLLPSEEPRLVRLQEATPDDWRLVIDGLAPFLKEKKLRSYQDVLGRRRAALQILIENVADPHNAQAALTVGCSPRQALAAARFEPAKKL